VKRAKKNSVTLLDRLHADLTAEADSRGMTADALANALLSHSLDRLQIGELKLPTGKGLA